ncbi:hypothetical protein C0Q70_15915 [Pomacea canaliculata]|uniref:Exonuclease domain-containing protein n=2 Tax=Pomacea canaliculata TaxID=400727 RepID=A0A2T7NNB3_POMCA|nr:hypothetical protein C0Q70_15915 [Pomacea canaliculata]
MSKIARIATSHRGVASVRNQNFDYFLVLDFEATCDRDRKLVPQEIIEFPVLKFNCRTLDVESEFHQYVQPRIYNQLTPFCIELTGIVQDMVENQPNIEETLEKFDEWMKKELLDPGARFSFVTCGDWDLKTMLPSQCQYFKITPRPYFNRWINIKKGFADVTGVFPKGLQPMLQELKIKQIGRHHSGIDDCRNIAAILKSLLEKGYIFSTTGTL